MLATLLMTALVGVCCEQGDSAKELKIHAKARWQYVSTNPDSDKKGQPGKRQTRRAESAKKREARQSTNKA